MSAQRSKWIGRRGQAGAETAIDLVIDGAAQAGEQVRQVADALIEDSPYQARQPFGDAEVEELAQGMRNAGFQGVLVVRPHGDVVRRRQGVLQLVYGHRRRAAWRLVCTERNEPCLLPVVVRELSDAEMLTIGAQENLQRQDLGPLEEAQLVAWHERVFFGKNQAEIGAMLGKSSDWVSVRSRIYRLPDALKASLQQRPRAIAQMLEIATLFSTQPDDAVALADRVVVENLSLDVVRAHVRGYARPERHTPMTISSVTPNVPEIHDEPREGLGRQESLPPPVEEAGARYARVPGEAATHEPIDTDERSTGRGAGTGDAGTATPVATTTADASDLLLLEEAAAALALIASRPSELPSGRRTTQVLEQIERSLVEIQSGFHRADSMRKG